MNNIKILIAEDDFTSRNFLKRLLAEIGDCDIAVNGPEAIKAYQESLLMSSPYQLICLDVMMPLMNGHEVLKAIRQIESESGILLSEGSKIIMTTGVSDKKSVIGAFKEGCESYLIKPIAKEKLIEELKKLRLTQ